MPEYTNIRVRRDAATALRDLALGVSVAARRRVSLSDTIHAVCATGSRHTDEVVRDLPDAG